MPSYGTVGSLDAKILDNADAPLSEFPLEPLQILRDPTLGPFLEIALRTQGLGRDSFGVDTQPHSTLLRWPAAGTGPNGALFRFGMLEDVTHQYPNGGNNPHGLAAAPEFWDFFSEHRLP